MIHPTCKIWQPSNVYPNATLGERVRVGAFTEIGPNVVVGGDTSIGAGSFIPDGVTIGKQCFIGPHVVFTNDKYPPSDKTQWQKTIVEDGASVGAGSTILCGTRIGSGSTIGAGSVVTKDVPSDVIYAGNPAKLLRRKTDEHA